MGKGGKDNCKTNIKNRVRSKDKDSDDSDEDYVVEVEENASDYDSEELVYSLDEYASGESYVEEEEEDEEEEEGFRKVVRSKTNKGSRENRRSGGKTSRKRKRVSYEEEEDDDYVVDDDFEADDDEDDVDYDDEFSPDDEDDDFLDEEEELTEKKKSNNMKVAKRKVQRSGSRRGAKERRKSKVSKKPSVKKGRKTRRLRKKVRHEYDDEDDGDFVDDIVSVREKSRKNSSVRRRRRYAVCSDSDVVSSGSSDYDFTISEEEGEQMMETSQFYGEVKTGLRSLSSVKKIQENGDSCEQEKPIARKGKEKIREEKAEVVKPVCGICLSEEDKRRFRGTLNCCSHYFCFTCIMEWSKVESRCPLCKQRFNTITKNGRVAVGVDLRNEVIQVPKRDQVYQPTEEEIRSFIDPYENVICTECHEGGDDGLMLLCDLCDSPAHTYCVGLGMQVPEGNWYCEGCRPVALGSSSSQAQDPFLDQRTANNISNRPSPVMNNGEGLGPNLETSPRLSFSQGFGNLSSPRFPVGDLQAVSPVSGAGAAPTVSTRRLIHRRIQNILNNMSRMANRADGDLAANLQSDVSNPSVDPCRENIVQNPRIRELGASQSAFLDVRFQINDHPSTSMQNRDPFPSRPSQLRAQVVQDPTIITTDRLISVQDPTFNLTLFPELPGINSISGNQQFTQCNSRPGITCEVNLVPHRGREESQFYVVKEQLQSVVKNHLRSLSQDIELGHDAFKEIARSSTHTILAACGLEHKRSEVQSVPAPLICVHGDRLITGQMSIMKDFCSPCFDSFVRGVVKRIMDTRLPPWLSLGL